MQITVKADDGSEHSFDIPTEARTRPAPQDSWPLVRLFVGNATVVPDCDELYYGPHPRIPGIGEHVAVQYKEHVVWRVEHFLGARTGPIAHVHLKRKPS